MSTWSPQFFESFKASCYVCTTCFYVTVCVVCCLNEYFFKKTGLVVCMHVSVSLNTLRYMLFYCIHYFSLFIMVNANFCSAQCWSITFCCIHLNLLVVHCCWIHFYGILQRCIRFCLIYLRLCTLHTFLLSTFLLQTFIIMYKLGLCRIHFCCM